MAYDEINGRKLWKSDGTSEGTVFVTSDIDPYYWNLTELNDTLYFSARDAANGMEMRSLAPQNFSVNDFNVDGKSDILWRNQADGRNAIWLMDGTDLQSGVLTSSVADPNWQMTGSGDFNGDGKSDILWRNQADGRNAIWLMDGTELQSGVLTTPVTDSNWDMI